MKISLITTLCGLALATPLVAEGNHSGVNQGFLKTAQEYENKAVNAEDRGNDHNATIFRKLAQIKREAAVAKGGYDWSEYYKLKEQLRFDAKDKQHGKKHKRKHADKEKVQHHKEHTEKAGNKTTQYISHAQKQAALANKATDNGDSYASQIHTRLAAIYIDAAAKQSNGEKINWTELKELELMLKKHLGN